MKLKGLDLSKYKLIYLADEGYTGGWGAVVQPEEVEPYSNKVVICILKRESPLEIGLRLKGKVFKKRPRYWTRGEYLGQQYVPGPILSNSGVVELVGEICKRNYSALRSQMIRGENCQFLRNFFKRGDLVLGDSGQYILEQCEREVAEIKDFVHDFVRSEEQSRTVPKGMHTKSLRLYAKEYDLEVVYTGSNYKIRRKEQ
jgi:hypothetical protein